ncbi:MAG: hypothetical protein ACLUIQ_10915 [Dialister invisus]
MAGNLHLANLPFPLKDGYIAERNGILLPTEQGKAHNLFTEKMCGVKAKDSSPIVRLAVFYPETGRYSP